VGLGYALGGVFELDASKRRRLTLAFGVCALTLFAVLRLTNVYGDPHPWSTQASPVFSVLSFINVTKYPPSFQYVLVTLGIGALLFALLEVAGERVIEVLRTFGRVPLFVYVLHIFLAHLAAGVIAYATGHGAQVLGNLFLFLPDEWGFDLLGVYAAWLCVLAVLYPACRWFAGVKERRRDWWLAYL
jgi:uncharacterized membrane protein